MLFLPFLFGRVWKKKRHKPFFSFFCLDEVYTDIGKFLKFYKSGPIPKAFKAGISEAQLESEEILREFRIFREKWPFTFFVVFWVVGGWREIGIFFGNSQPKMKILIDMYI